MSAAQRSLTESKLEALECHFTWDLNASRSKLCFVRDMLEDIGAEGGSSWLGHIYNLQGFVHYQLGCEEEALRFLCRATEVFRQMRNAVPDDGPWLVVNYGNLAYLHHLLGDQSKSQHYLSKVEILLNAQEELYPEICAEKAWTLMWFDKRQLATEHFHKAVRMQPDMVEWQTGRVLGLVEGYKIRMESLGDDILEKMKIAKEHDPDNLHLAALYLQALAARGQQIEDEARALARRILRKPVSCYSGFEPLLRLFRKYVCMDEAIDLAEEALQRHPESRYVKRCAAICYKRRIFAQKSPHDPKILDRGISLCEDVVALYPESSLKMQMSLAEFYAKFNQERADEIFRTLLEKDLDPEGSQMLFSIYASHLFFIKKKEEESIHYHKKAAMIQTTTYFGQKSIAQLVKIAESRRHPRAHEIQEFLESLHGNGF
ncbi:hypothetical protein OJAV_G00034040 [Oryzias javanicus]|uniref:Uncharacterized protein n=1 Tax=Oryzias javanicus TaxID=123683 RepID=A0A437DFM4_ORYJA|nr:hypothetical protein OJAV_G00034040 [Oryzias javanicus]